MTQSGKHAVLHPNYTAAQTLTGLIYLSQTALETLITPQNSMVKILNLHLAKFDDYSIDAM